MIPLKIMHMVYVAGLRGAVSFSCATAFNNSSKNRYTLYAYLAVIILRQT